MSDYRNFISDFPSRCMDVLRLAENLVRERDRDVTLLIMAASAAIVVPYERLKADPQIIQPIGDRHAFPQAARDLDQLLTRPFLGSPLWPPSPSSWCFGHVRSLEGGPEQWAELRAPAPLADDVLVDDVLFVLRTGLAHGNMITRAGNRGEISALIFLCGGVHKMSGRKLPVKYCLVSPPDLRELLSRWLQFLRKVELPEGIVLTELAVAA